MLRSNAQLPSFAGATEWLGASFDERALAGGPVLVQFWALSCHLCKEHLPIVRRMAEQLGPRGLRVVSVHMPRHEGDLDVDEVRRFAEAAELHVPIAIDNAHEIGQRFETGGLWPHYFVFDAHGRLRARAAGAKGIEVVEATARRLIAEAA